MIRRVSPWMLAGLVMAVAGPAFAQSGIIVCEQDLKRASQLYEQKQSVLTEAERKEATDLMSLAEDKCRAGGADALNTRSPEATALLEKLESAPLPSQAAVPSER